MRRSLAIPAIAAALVLSGCSASSGGSASGGGSAPAPARATPSAAAPTTTPPPVLSAADGTDLKACAKAECQVIVRGQADVPVGRKYGLVDVKLTHVPPNRLAFVIVRTGLVSGHIDGTGRLSLADGVTITVEKMTPKGAVVRFGRGPGGKDSDQVSGSEGASMQGYG